MAGRFGLSDVFDSTREKVEELEHSDDANVRSYDDTGRVDEGPFKPFTFQNEDFDRTEPDKDAMRKYWRQFETTPFVRKSVTSFARQVMEPGYYIEAREVDNETLRELDHWLSSAAIVEGERGQDFRKLAKKAVVQQEVRGTTFIEKAPDKNDPDDIAGLKLINAETMEAVTRPGQSMLLQPEDIDDFEGAPSAESGGAAAWLQDLGETETFFGTPVRGRDRGLDNDKDDDFKIGFRDDEIIKLSRDADAGEIFGTSRLEAVSDRIEGLRNKLSDNDDAIASKAYPLWLFMFGSEDNPWEASDINEFMKSHEMENFHSGMKQGVRGDVSVETVSGEVAEIADSLNFDIEWIMSIMPIPKHALGAFSKAGSTVTQFGGVAQQQETQRQIKDTRRDVEEKFTPMLQEVAQQFGVGEEAVESIELKIGSPGEPETEVPRRENVIRYVPEDQRDDNTSETPETPVPGADEDNVPKGPLGGENDNTPESPQDAPEEASAQVWHTYRSSTELAIRSDSARSELSDAIYDAMIRTRDETLSQVSDEYGNAPTFAATKFESIANSVLRETLSRRGFRDDVEPTVESLMPEDEGNFTRSTNVKFFLQDIEYATENAIEEMLRLMRIQVRRAANAGDDWDSITARIQNEYDNARLRERADLIAHMELKNARETIKLRQFENDPDVVGVRVENENPSTPLTRSLDGAEAHFADGEVVEQLMEQTREEYLHDGFDPLPPTPPFHFNDTSSLVPITEE